MQEIEEKILLGEAQLDELIQWEQYVFDNFTTIDLDRVKKLRQKVEEIKHKNALKDGVNEYLYAYDELCQIEQSKEVQEYLQKIKILEQMSGEELKILKQYCKPQVIARIAEIAKIKTPKVFEKKDFYTQEDHLREMPMTIRELYNALKNCILELGEVEIKPTRVYIIFAGQKKNIGSVLIQKKQIKVYPNLKFDEIIDPYKIVADISQKGIWGRDCEIEYTQLSQLERIMDIMKQSYRLNG